MRRAPRVEAANVAQRPVHARAIGCCPPVLCRRPHCRREHAGTVRRDEAGGSVVKDEATRRVDA